ncbi:MAG: hypothetical protein ACLTQI_05960 [Slackia sp.]
MTLPPLYSRLPDGSGIECLHDAFTDCAGASQELIVLPSSLVPLLGILPCGAVKSRIDNPDVRLARDSVYDEGHIYAPCDEDQPSMPTRSE